MGVLGPELAVPGQSIFPVETSNFVSQDSQFWDVKFQPTFHNNSYGNRRNSENCADSSTFLCNPGPSNGCGLFPKSQANLSLHQ